MKELKKRMDPFLSPILSEHVVQWKTSSIFVKDMTNVFLEQMDDKTLQIDITNDNIRSTLWVRVQCLFIK